MGLSASTDASLRGVTSRSIARPGARPNVAKRWWKRLTRATCCIEQAPLVLSLDELWLKHQAQSLASLASSRRYLGGAHGNVPDMDGFPRPLGSHPPSGTAFGEHSGGEEVEEGSEVSCDALEGSLSSLGAPELVEAARVLEIKLNAIPDAGERLHTPTFEPAFRSPSSDGWQKSFAARRFNGLPPVEALQAPCSYRDFLFWERLGTAHTNSTQSKRLAVAVSPDEISVSTEATGTETSMKWWNELTADQHCL